MEQTKDAMENESTISECYQQNVRDKKQFSVLQPLYTYTLYTVKRSKIDKE